MLWKWRSGIASWNFGIIIVRLCTAPAIRKDGIPYLQVLIEEHHTLLQRLHHSQNAVYGRYIPDEMANNSFFSFLSLMVGTSNFCCAKSIIVLPFLKEGLDQHRTFEPCDFRPSTLSSRDCFLRILKTFQEPWHYKNYTLCKIADFFTFMEYFVFLQGAFCSEELKVCCWINLFVKCFLASYIFDPTDHLAKSTAFATWSTLRIVSFLEYLVFFFQEFFLQRINLMWW